MKFASEDLINEHEGILFGLSIIEEMVHLLRQKKKVDIEDMKDMIDFLKLFADKCHHGKEEGLYFPALERAGIQKENGPIGQMLLEHVKGRQYIADMSEAIKADAFLEGAFIEAAENYMNLLRAHIKKENNVLFPMGDQKLQQDVQTKLINEFEEFEEEVMGKGTHEKLHALLDKLEEKYLIS